MKPEFWRVMIGDGLGILELKIVEFTVHFSNFLTIVNSPRFSKSSTKEPLNKSE